MDVIHFIFVICIFMAIYGGLHYYLYRKLRTLLPAHKRAIGLSLSIFAASVIVVEVLIHTEATLFIIPIAWASYFWMGLVVIFFGISLPIDLLAWLSLRSQSFNLTRRVARRITKSLESPIRTVFVALLVFELAIYGTFGAQQINVEKITLESTKLSRPLRIVQITDLHIGSLTQESHIQRIVKAVNDLNADIIVSTGDLVDMSTDPSEALISKLAALHSRLGKFSIYGNHETFVGLKKSRQLIEHAGFTLLSNSGVTLDGVINLFGVDDPSVVGRMQPGARHPDEPMPTFSNAFFTVLLKHQPIVTLTEIPTFDLQLSGHVHGGQIYPFGLLTRMVYRVPMGLSRISEESWLYVSFGTGTWGPPMRVFAPPEITLFQLQPTETPKR